MGTILNNIEVLLKPNLDEKILQFLVTEGGWIAGGALTSVINRSKINDIDIYLPTKEIMHKFITEFGRRAVHSSDKSVSFSVGGMVSRGVARPIHQLITLRPFTSAQDIFDCFDFTVNMVAWGPKTNTVDLHDDCILHNSQRYLHFNECTTYPYMSLLRVQKYQDKGYKITKPQLLKIAMACGEKGITSWQEALEQFGGLYGESVELGQYLDKPCTFENIISLLDEQVCVFRLGGGAVKFDIPAIANTQSGIKPIAYKLGDRYVIEETDQIVALKEDTLGEYICDDEDYQNGYTVDQLDVQEDTFFEKFVGKYLYNRTAYNKRRWFEAPVDLPYLAEIPDEDAVQSVNIGDGYLTTNPQKDSKYIHKATAQEMEDIKNGVYLHWMAYPEHVEAYERKKKIRERSYINRPCSS